MMEIRIPKDLLDYLDAVRGDKSRQAYMVNILDKEYKEKGREIIIEKTLKSTFISASK